MILYNKLNAPFGAKRPNAATCLILSGSRMVYMSNYLADRLKVKQGDRITIGQTDVGELFIHTQDDDGWELVADSSKRTTPRLRAYSAFINTYLRERLTFGKAATIYIPVAAKPEELKHNGKALVIYPLLMSGAYTPTKRGV